MNIIHCYRLVVLVVAVLCLDAGTKGLHMSETMETFSYEITNGIINEEQNLIKHMDHCRVAQIFSVKPSERVFRDRLYFFSIFIMKKISAIVDVLINDVDSDLNLNIRLRFRFEPVNDALEYVNKTLTDGLRIFSFDAFNGVKIERGRVVCGEFSTKDVHAVKMADHNVNMTSNDFYAIQRKFKFLPEEFANLTLIQEFFAFESSYEIDDHEKNMPPVSKYE